MDSTTEPVAKKPLKQTPHCGEAPDGPCDARRTPSISSRRGVSKPNLFQSTPLRWTGATSAGLLGDCEAWSGPHCSTELSGRVINGNGVAMDEEQTSPSVDLPAICDDHLSKEFVHLDLDATMATSTDAPYPPVPMFTERVRAEEVRQFYPGFLIDQRPEDLNVTPVSRTVGEHQVADELVVIFTHCSSICTGTGVAPRPRSAPGSSARSPHLCGASS